jgi:hypothetical protein
VGEVEAEDEPLFIGQDESGGGSYFDSVEEVVDFFLFSFVDEEVVVASGENQKLAACHHISDQAIALVNFVYVDHLPALPRVLPDITSGSHKYRVRLLAVGNRSGLSSQTHHRLQRDLIVSRVAKGDQSWVA